jgi:SAM-dependent MidA family methyltransferase
MFWQTFGSIRQTRGLVQAVHLVETSNRLREAQKNRLESKVSEGTLHWHDRLEEIPKSGRQHICNLGRN